MISYSRKNSREFDWEGILRRVGKYMWLIVLATVFWSTLMLKIGEKVTPPVYVATTRIAVLRETGDGVLEPYDLSLSKYMAYDFTQMVYSRNVIEKVIEKLEWNVTYEYMRRHIFVSKKSNACVLDIIVTDQNPDRARNVANMVREETYLFMKETLKIADVMINVVDDGSVSEERHSINMKYWFLPGAFGGFSITTAIIIIVYLLEDSVRKTEDIEKRLRLSVLGSIPKKTEANKQEVAEAYNRIRTNIEFAGTDIKVFAITSTIPNEGKSSVAYELAEAFAKTEKRVLLIDADLRKSVLIGRHCKGRVSFGLVHYLAGKQTFEEVCAKTDVENFQVIYAGWVPANPCELLSSRKFEELLSTAKGQYDMVIVDTPPIGSVIDAAIVTSKCDGAVYVIAAETVSLRFIKNVKQQLEDTGKPILGCVLNKMEKNKDMYQDEREMEAQQWEEYEPLFSNSDMPVSEVIGDGC